MTYPFSAVSWSIAEGGNLGDNSDRVGTYLVAGLMLGAIIMGIAYGIPRWDWSAEFWFGTKPLMDYVIGLATIAAASTAAAAAIFTLRMNINGAYASRFQKGIELLAETQATASNGGIEILRDLVRARPKDYLRPFVRTMMHFITEQHPTDWQLMRDGKLPEDGQIPVSASTLRAVSALAVVPIATREKFDDSQKILLFRPLLSMIEFRGNDFISFRVSGGMVTRAGFVGCTFKDCSFDFSIRKALRFEDCSFDNVTIKKLWPAKNGGEIIFKDTKVFQGVVLDGDDITADGTY